MDWVHCNRCYLQPGDVEMKKFFLTNCGHIYCDVCLKLNRSNECKICHMKYITTPLTANMSPEVEIYFHDPLNDLKKQLKISEFQKSHRTRLMGHYKDIIKNYKTMKKENCALNEELKICKKENAILREELQQTKSEFHNFEQSMRFESERSQRNPQLNSFSHFIVKENVTTPNTERKCPGSNEVSEKSFRSGLKRPANSNFFFMTESLPSDKKKFLATPEVSRFPGEYRVKNSSTPKISSPESLIRELSQRDPLQRKVKLPTSRNGTTSRLGFQGLYLSRRTSTPYKDSGVTNKYSKYFK